LVLVIQNMNYLSTALFTGGGSFFIGMVIGYAIEKVVRVLPVILGILFAIMAYFDYSNSITVNWRNVQIRVGNGTIYVYNQGMHAYHYHLAENFPDNGVMIGAVALPFTMGIGIRFRKG
jgi:uncharacterized membrane protein (Fun14 family)